MKHLVPGTTDTLLDCAQKEFLEKGFENASLRKISFDCGVSTHTIYTRFGDKNGLFSAIVKDAAADLPEKITFKDKIFFLDSKEDFSFLDFIYSNYSVYKLLLCSSKGSIYENYLEKLSLSEEKNFKKNIKKIFKSKSDADSFFVRSSLKSFYSDLCEILKNDLSLKNAKIFFKRSCRFKKAGWQALLESDF